MTATEKVVDGKYIVTEFQPGGAPEPFVMVVTYDQKQKIYYKWLLLPDGNVAEWVGTGVTGKRMLSWLSTDARKGASQLVLTSEVHGDDSTQWREIILEEGEVVRIIEGTALKTK